MGSLTTPMEFLRPTGDFRNRETRLAGPSNELERMQIAFVIDTVARAASYCRVDKAYLLVVANPLGRDSGRIGRLSNIHFLISGLSVKFCKSCNKPTRSHYGKVKAIPRARSLT